MMIWEEAEPVHGWGLTLWGAAMVHAPHYLEKVRKCWLSLSRGDGEGKVRKGEGRLGRGEADPWADWHGKEVGLASSTLARA